MPNPVLTNARYGRCFVFDSEDTLYALTATGWYYLDADNNQYIACNPSGTAPTSALGGTISWVEIEGEGTDTFTVYTTVGKVDYQNFAHSTPNQWGTETTFTAPAAGWEDYGMTRVINGQEIRLFVGDTTGGNPDNSLVYCSIDDGTPIQLSEQNNNQDHHPCAIVYQNTGSAEYVWLVYLEFKWPDDDNLTDIRFRRMDWNGSSWGNPGVSSTPITSISTLGIEPSHEGASMYVDSSSPSATSGVYDQCRVFFREAENNYMYKFFLHTVDDTWAWYTGYRSVYSTGTADNNDALAMVADEYVVDGVHYDHGAWCARGADSGSTYRGPQTSTGYSNIEDLKYAWWNSGGLGGYSEFSLTGNMSTNSRGQIFFTIAIRDWYDYGIRRTMYDPVLTKATHDSDLLIFVDYPRKRVHGADIYCHTAAEKGDLVPFNQNSFVTGSSIQDTNGHFVFGFNSVPIEIEYFAFEAVTASTYTVEIGLGTQWNTITEVLATETKTLTAGERAFFFLDEDPIPLPSGTSENWYYKISYENPGTVTLHYSGSGSVGDGTVTLAHWWSDDGNNNDSWTPGHVSFVYRTYSAQDYTNSYYSSLVDVYSNYHRWETYHWNTNGTVYRTYRSLATEMKVDKSTDDGATWSNVHTETAPTDHFDIHGFNTYLVNDGGSLSNVGSSIDGSHIQIIITWEDIDDGGLGHNLQTNTSTIIQTDDCIAGTDSVIENQSGGSSMGTQTGQYSEGPFTDVIVYDDGLVLGVSPGSPSPSYTYVRSTQHIRPSGASTSWTQSQWTTNLYYPGGYANRGIGFSNSYLDRGVFGKFNNGDLVAMGSTYSSGSLDGINIKVLKSTGTGLVQNRNTVFEPNASDRSLYRAYRLINTQVYSNILYTSYYIKEYNNPTIVSGTPADYRFMIFNRSGDDIDSGLYVYTPYFLDYELNPNMSYDETTDLVTSNGWFFYLQTYTTDGAQPNPQQILALRRADGTNLSVWQSQVLPEFGFGGNGYFGSITLWEASHERLAIVAIEEDGDVPYMYYVPITGAQHIAYFEPVKEFPYHHADLTLQGAVKRIHDSDVYSVDRLTTSHSSDIQPAFKRTSQHSADLIPAKLVSHNATVSTYGTVQESHPDMDGEYDSGWIAAPDKGAPLWKQVDEDTADDSDYIWYLAPKKVQHAQDVFLPISRHRSHGIDGIFPYRRNKLHATDVSLLHASFTDTFSTNTLSDYTVTGTAASWNAGGWIDVSTGDNLTTIFARNDTNVTNNGYAYIDWVYGSEWAFGDQYVFWVMEDANNYIRMFVADSYYGNRFERVSGGVIVESVNLSSGTTEPPTGTFRMTFEWSPTNVTFGIDGGTLCTHTPTGWIGEATEWRFELSQLVGDWLEIYHEAR